MNPSWDDRVRTAVFEFLYTLVDQSLDGTVVWADLKRFQVDGQVVHLLGARGIWTPAGMDSALTITTTYTPPNQQPPYADSVGTDGLIRYKYQGTDPQSRDNVALRRAMTTGAGLAYFIGLAKGVYVPRWPVWIVAEDPARMEFAVAVDEGLRLVPEGPLQAPQRAYAARLVQERLHQPVFRSRVLRAYQTTCAMCRLRHAELLDAAHIIADGLPLGDPVVPNGLALCKIHHAAFDRNILGVRPDLVVEVKTRILQEIDGPMLRYGLQEMHGARLTVPRSRDSRPDSDRLEQRYEEFRAAS